MAAVLLGINEGTGRLYAGPTLMAVGRGYFSEQGLDVEVIEAGGNRGSLPLVADGRLDVSPRPPTLAFFRAWNPSRPMRIVADQGSLAPGRGGGALVARKELLDNGSLRDCADLRGKRIALSPTRGDHDWLEFAAALRSGGLTFDDVEIVPMDFGHARYGALAEGRVDVCVLGRLQSLIDVQELAATAVWKYRHEVCPGRTERTIIFSHRFWSERPAEAQRFVVAYLNGVRDYHNAFEYGVGREGVIETLAEQTGYSVEALATEMVPNAINPDGYVNVAGIAQDLEWFVEQGLLPRKLEMEQLVDHGFIEAARAELGPYSPPIEMW